MIAANIQLAGQVPEELRVLTEMEEFDVSINKKITGNFPSFARHLPKLKSLALHYCGLSGTLPDWMGEMLSLDTLTLSNNDFKGVMPMSIGQLSLLGTYTMC